ncbi:YdeI/OmpD-associated family protein [Pontibacter sp. SGAir0037]|uniref:DUF1905 domain-containing protein n=1 Tax=Pontibacter sp. SGAir0037 TaxID=2571030 RepID=UPI0010CD2501|nr:YdeI/OmpD-associated family protein [Pontibacter sp. SGAir0037]QCR25099.1 hypothetical protein C1N53_14945 [Pontibacter sp. SGAir0037]
MPAPEAPIVFETSINRLEYLVGMHYLEVPQPVVQQLGGKLKVRLLCTVNNQLTFQCGLMALGNGSAYISLNTKRLKQLKLKAGDKAVVALAKDESKYGMEIPEELAELLQQDDEGNKRFNLLTPGKQRYIIHYVASVKSSQLRIDRAILLIKNLKKLPVGNESFRAMLGLPERV